MSGDIISLHWNNFQSYLCLTQQELLQDNKLTDVTLVSDDGKHFQAHRIVLSAASTVLKNLLLTQTDSISVIFMTGVNKRLLQAILEYIYLKKVVISKDEIDSFMEIATAIDIKGIDIDNKGIFSNENKPNKNDDNFHHQIKKEIKIKEEEQQCKAIVEEYQAPVKRENEKDEKIMVTLEEKLGFTYSNNFCKECGAKFFSAFQLHNHIQVEHKSERYRCEDCSSSFTLKSSLKRHVLTIHNGVRYTCDLCHAEFSETGSLRRHQKTRHEGLQYPCVYCEYVANDRSNLTRHQATQHDGERFSCNLCDFKCIDKRSLRRHLIKH